jgi:HEAT repeat protein
MHDLRSIVERLIAALETDNLSVYETAVDLLCDIGSEALPQLLEALQHPDKGVRLAVIYVLGQLGSEAATALPALERFLREEDDELQEAAQSAIAQIKQDVSDLEEAA